MFVCELTRIKTYSHTDRQINKTRRKAVIGTDIVKLTDRQKDKADRQTRQDMQTERKTQIQTVKQDIQKDSNGYRQSNILTDRQSKHAERKKEKPTYGHTNRQTDKTYIKAVIGIDSQTCPQKDRQDIHTDKT